METKEAELKKTTGLKQAEIKMIKNKKKPVQLLFIGAKKILLQEWHLYQVQLVTSSAERHSFMMPWKGSSSEKIDIGNRVWNFVFSFSILEIWNFGLALLYSWLMNIIAIKKWGLQFVSTRVHVLNHMIFCVIDMENAAAPATTSYR